jgi:hypothetical protein
VHQDGREFQRARSQAVVDSAVGTRLMYHALERCAAKHPKRSQRVKNLQCNQQYLFRMLQSSYRFYVVQISRLGGSTLGYAT